MNKSGQLGFLFGVQGAVANEAGVPDELHQSLQEFIGWNCKVGYHQ